MSTIRGHRDTYHSDFLDQTHGSSNEFMKQQKSTIESLTQSKVQIKEKHVVGKNAPPKIPMNRPKAIPSIPSSTVAPPEDITKNQA